MEKSVSAATTATTTTTTETSTSRTTTTAACSSTSGPNSSSELSKRGKKRLLRLEQWLRERPARRAAERAKAKAKNKAKRDVEARESEKEEDKLPYSVERKRLKSMTMASSSCKTHLVLDMSLGDEMSDKDLSKCVKQVLRCYSSNRRLSSPTQMHLTSVSGRALQELQRHQGYENWDVHKHEQHYTQCFESEKIVYLTSDSDHVLHELQQDGVYIIGALVDHNAKKGLCYKLAREYGVGHARLPLSEHLEMKTRHVLTVDQVFSIMADVANGTNWLNTFIKYLPSRKGAVIKHSDVENEDKKDKGMDEEEEKDGTEEAKDDDKEDLNQSNEAKEIPPTKL